jgi:hypothetical protein
MIVLFVAVVAVVALVVVDRGRRRDLPERLVSVATRRLPPDRHAWGRALVAEMAAISDRRARWRFSIGALRLALFPPIARPAVARATAAVGALVTVAATLATVRLAPTLSVFVPVLGLLTSGYATAVASRRPDIRVNPVRLAAGAVAVIGVLAAAGAVAAIAVTYPAATRDETHVFSVVLAVALCGYLVAGVSAAVGGANGIPLASVWAGLAGAVGAVVASAVFAAPFGLLAPIPPITAIATFATALFVGLITRDRSAATRGGVLTAILSTPITFAITLGAADRAHPSVLTDPYDVAAYPRSGYPDVASYVLSDTVAGNVVGLVVTPLAMCAVAVVGAALAARRTRTV